jgi:Holliday junction DNA helicase RuvA
MQQEATVHTHLQVREDDLSLYGFTEPETLGLYELLLTVSGVGPKLALAIVNGGPATALYQAIMANELTQLTKIPGVGKKTAQRLVLELKEKITAISPELPDLEPVSAGLGDNSVAAQVVAALTALGYRSEEALGALRAAERQSPEKATRVDDWLRESLKYLGGSLK